MIKFKKVNPHKDETYEVATDDHCLVVKSGASQVWISKSMAEWIGANHKKYTD